MALQAINVKIQGGEQYTVQFDVPETLEEAKERWGEDVVYSRFKASTVIDLQSGMRGVIRADDFSADKLQLYAESWKPGVKTRGRTKDERLIDALDALSDEDRAELLSKYEID
ncbi:hypothetical protein LCGC14_3123230 [marine sediment metagenome]|uniref:Uncharacterized protein n=1 Tax=marine sediment metagenome TaxID=412755 RepID=A0A0F8W1X4_9ZZZZ